MPTHIPRRRRAEDESEIDLTPMLDVVFILLVFFLVTASFVKETGIRVARPPPQSVADAGKRSIVLTVGADNAIRLGERRIDVRAVRAAIEPLHAADPGAAVLIRAHEDSDTEVFAAIADQSREAGVWDVSITTFAD